MSDYNFLIQQINEKIAKSFTYTGTVIDLGCGDAPYKEHIINTAKFYIGVDWPTGFHSHANVDVFANLFEGLPFLSNSTDTAISYQVLEHIPEPGLFLLEVFRVLKTGGKIILTVPFMWQVHEAPHDYYRYTRYGLQYLLNKAGFIQIEIHENTGFWQTWVLKLNYHTLRFARGPLRIFFIPVWWFGQIISPVLDKIIQTPQETASYTVIAIKP